MVITDLFGEDVGTNCRILYVPNKDQIGDIADHIGPGDKDFSEIKVSVLAVGHHDLKTRLGQFISDYKRLVNALRVHNSNMLLLVMSVLPIGEDTSLHKFAALKSQQIKENFGRKPGMTYINFYANLSIQGEIPPEFLRNFKLNRLGIKRFFNVMNKQLAGNCNFVA